MEKTKLLAILVLGIIALTMIFGCTTPVTDGNTSKVTNQMEANKTLNDASTNLSGVKNTLDDIDNSLTNP